MHGIRVGIEIRGRSGRRGDGVGFGRRPGRVASRLTSDFHPQSKRFHVALAVLSSFFDEEFAIVDDYTDKTLVTQDVATFGVGVSQAPIGEFAQATIFTFCSNKKLKNLTFENKVQNGILIKLPS
jgi:hypothetical protein